MKELLVYFHFVRLGCLSELGLNYHVRFYKSYPEDIVLY